MEPIESDIELEQRARAQAEAIAQAHAVGQKRPMQQFWQALGRTLRLSPPEPEPVSVPQKPGRELLLWQIKQAPDLASAWPLVATLLQEPRFLATVPAERDCPLVVFQSRRKWNEAAREWSQSGGGDRQTWLRCDRKLILRKRQGTVTLHVSVKDLCVRFDKATDKLVPLRVEGTQQVDLAAMGTIAEKFPSLTLLQLVDSLKSPTRLLVNGRARVGQDAYVAGGPLVANMEMYVGDKKKKKEDKEDPSKGLATWLASVLRSSAAK